MDMPRAIKNLVLIGSSAYFVKTQVGEVLYGKGPSMEPTIPNGSFVLIDRMSWRWRKYERGDIVLMKSPTRPNTTICKRILAMEGDTVTLQPRFDESRTETIKIPKGHIWVEGDNATMSVDSRQVGAMPYSLILGRVRYCIWPSEYLGPLK